MPAPAAAYAVPLALAGTIILAASIVGIHQYRKLLQERREEKERLAQSTDRGPRRMGLGSPMSSFRTTWSDRTDKSAGTLGYGGEVEKVQIMPDKTDIYTRMYVPTGDRGRYPGPTNDRERERTREAFRRRDVHAYPATPTPAGRGHAYPATSTPAHRGHAQRNITPVHPTVPVGVFRSAMSPQVPQVPQVPRSAPQGESRAKHGRRDVEAQMNANTNDNVVSHYLRPSPVPGYPASPSQAHVRRAAPYPAPSPNPADDALYNAVERKLYHSRRGQR